MTNEETIKHLKEMVMDVNEKEIRSHEGDALEKWSEAWRREMNRLIDGLNCNPETVSHSERYILEGCLDLTENLVDMFCEYLDLFLQHTSHSGGTSTREKCRELGIDDATKTMWFDFTDKMVKEWLRENEREGKDNE